ncbi:MAG TPA: hypothetical protein VFR02_04985, partial [bacterium]|nr:hypothetical protein [bacterium]
GSTANPPSQAPASTAGGAQSSEGQTTPGGSAVQATFLDQIDIRFSETIRGKASADQVQQSMAALASAFQQMVGFLLSNPGATADQVQGQIVAATQGTVSPDAAKALVAAVQGFLQSLPPSQKALLSDESTRKNLFNQLFQGLGQAVAGAQPAALGGSTTETFDFQMAFGTQSVTSAGAGTQGSQFFEAGLSMAGFNDQNLRTSFTNSVLDGGPLTGASLADLSQQENVLLTNLASQSLASSTTATPGQTNGMGRALADLLGRAGAGRVDLASFTQAQPTTSADQLNRVAPVDFNRVFALLTDSLRQASAIPPVTPSDTLQAPSPAMLPAFGTLPPSAPETSILAAPAVVTLQNPTPQTLSTADPTDRILAVRQFFEQLSVSFNSVTAASTPA